MDDLDFDRWYLRLEVFGKVVNKSLFFLDLAESGMLGLFVEAGYVCLNE